MAIFTLAKLPIVSMSPSSVLKIGNFTQVVRIHTSAVLASVINGTRFLNLSPVMKYPGSPMGCNHLPVVFVCPANLRIAVTSYRVGADPALTFHYISSRCPMGNTIRNYDPLLRLPIAIYARLHFSFFLPHSAARRELHPVARALPGGHCPTGRTDYQTRQRTPSCRRAARTRLHCRHR